MKRTIATITLSACCVLGALTADAQVAAANPSASAATGQPGSITGRVFNPNTGEYVRNAQIRIEETGQTASRETVASSVFLRCPRA